MFPLLHIGQAHQHSVGRDFRFLCQAVHGRVGGLHNLAYCDYDTLIDVEAFKVYSGYIAQAHDQGTKHKFIVVTCVGVFFVGPFTARTCRDCNLVGCGLETSIDLNYSCCLVTWW